MIDISVKRPIGNDNKTATFHLRKYYYIAETVGFSVPTISGLAMFLFPQYFSWITFPIPEMAAILFAFGLTNAVLLIAHEVTGKNLFFNLNRYLFVIMYILIIVGTGGVDSSFIFVLIFPFIVSAVYLEKKMTRNIGVFLTILYSLIIFLPSLHDVTPFLIAKHVVQIILLSIISFMMYRIVMESLRVKYEKEETARRLSELMEVDRIKSDFLSVAQHRLRTPLSAVRYALETIAEETGISGSAKEVAADGLSRVKESIAIVNEMLKTAEDKSDVPSAMVYEPIDMAKMIKSIAEELTFMVSKNDNAIYVSSPESLVIEADPEKIRAAIINVVDNACRYTTNGKIDISLMVTDVAVLTVRDTGMGIPADDLPYIFERLHRGKNAIKADPDESGVGLYITKKIIELHNGTIGIDSELGSGTTVTIRLPLRHFSV